MCSAPLSLPRPIRSSGRGWHTIDYPPFLVGRLTELATMSGFTSEVRKRLPLQRCQALHGPKMPPAVWPSSAAVLPGQYILLGATRCTSKVGIP